METLKETLDSLWQVVLVGLLLGAGLPAIFAFGLRALSVGETDVSNSNGSGSNGSNSNGSGSQVTTARPAIATAAAVACFAAVVVAIVAGILFIMKDFLASSFGITVF